LASGTPVELLKSGEKCKILAYLSELKSFNSLIQTAVRVILAEKFKIVLKKMLLLVLPLPYRYENTFQTITQDVVDLEAKVNAHLKKMGFKV